MKFRSVKQSDIPAADAIVVPLFDDRSIPKALDRSVRAVVERIAKENEAARLYTVSSHIGDATRVVVVGAGKRGEFDGQRARRVASAALKSLWRSRTKRLALVLDTAAGLDAASAARAAVEGILFAMWRPEAHRTKEEDRRLAPLDTVLLAMEGDAKEAIRRGEAAGEAVNVARRLANEPANKMTPTALAAEAKRLAADAGVECEVLNADRCRALGMHSFLSVAQGSHEPPQFIVMRHAGRGGKGYDAGLVGKGITFDSGGISIKPAEAMHRMKADMTGAAAVIAAMTALGRLRTRANVIAVAPCTENLPGGGATKPGDVFTSMSGKTVEVINTDAEGRLVLVDGITYVQREGARRVVDVATLTGAIAVALGHHYSGLFGKPEAFVEEVVAAARAAGDRVWPMPLSDEYREEIRSDIADIANSAGRDGGAIKAAAFLDAAVEDGTQWAHLDVAGTYWAEQDRPYTPKGPQGPAVRTLIELGERLASG